MNPTPAATTFAGCQVKTPAHTAAHAARARLAELSILAKGGDPDALRELHSTISDFVDLLNERHLDFAESVMRWPILLPREKEARTAVAAKARRMSIGSVKDVANGRPVKLAKVSNRGFALVTLRRLEAAGRILRMGSYDGQDYGPGDSQWCNPWMCDADFMERFQETTGIGMTDVPLLLTIRDLPDYCPDTRQVWIDAMVRTLKAFPDLVPAIIQARKRTDRGFKAGPKKESHGQVVERALMEGLKKVVSVPRVF